jgi:hypothetical protein
MTPRRKNKEPKSNAKELIDTSRKKEKPAEMFVGKACILLLLPNLAPLCSLNISRGLSMIINC